MTTTIHNFDENLQEFFEFKVMGHTYRFRHLNTEEMEAMQPLLEENQKLQDYLYQFITKVDPNSPEFPEVAKKMIMPQWNRFREMIKVEFSVT